jgi:predicted HTH transcriptional regulator
MADIFVKPKYIRSFLDLERHVQLGVTTESIYMDFKLDIGLSSLSTQKKKQEVAEELALDICQFANAWGGIMLIGVKEADSVIGGKKVAEEFIGVSNFEDVSRFVSDSVLLRIHPKDIKIDLVSIETPTNVHIVAINISPLAVGVSCVYNPSSPFSPKYPYRTH